MLAPSPGSGGTGSSIPASGTPGAALSQQIAQHIAANLPKPVTDLGTGTLEITLDPPELGRVRMSLVEIAGTITLSIVADRPETAELMRGTSTSLRRNSAGPVSMRPVSGLEPAAKTPGARRWAVTAPRGIPTRHRSMARQMRPRPTPPPPPMRAPCLPGLPARSTSDFDRKALRWRSFPIRHAPTGQSPSTAETDQTVITADFQTFLQLLTTQLKNQDPLNPMESTEYATQLATFSGVEQQVRTNELLETLSNGYATLGLGQLSGWIGMQATAEMPVAFSGAPVTVQTTPRPARIALNWS
jgi:hypothetical protein